MKTRAIPAAPVADDPAILARQATDGSAVAMRQGRYADARNLAALADSYERMAARRRTAAAAEEEEPQDAAAEQALRDDLLRRLDALAADIQARQAEEAAAAFSPDAETAISGA